MPFAAPDNFSFRPYAFPPITGGLTFTQATDSDAVAFDNVEILRDKFVRARRGATASHVTGALGSARILGMDVTVAGSVTYLIIAKEAKTFYATPTSGITAAGVFGTITPFDVPTAPVPSGSAWAVRMTSVVKTGDTPEYSTFMCHASWSKMVKWTGTGAATEVASTFACADIAFHTDNRLWAVKADRFTLAWSDPGAPESWPTTNNVSVSSAYGPIMAMMSFPDRMMLFCSRGILSATGDPDMDNFRINVDHPNIGLQDPYTLSNFGNTAMFLYEGCAYQFSGTVSLISDAIRNKFGSITGSTASLGEFGYIVRIPNQAADAQGSSSFFYDRVRYGFWSRWMYPATTGLGGAIAYPAMKYSDGYWFMAGTGGNVYAQSCWGARLSDGDIELDQRMPQIPDAPNNTPVRVAVSTRVVDLGDDLLTKAWRAVQIYGYGSNANVTLTMYDYAGNQQNVQMANGISMPCELNTPAVDGTAASPVTEFNEARLTLKGDYMFLKKIVLWWRPVRYGQISYKDS